MRIGIFSLFSLASAAMALDLGVRPPPSDVDYLCSTSTKSPHVSDVLWAMSEFHIKGYSSVQCGHRGGKRPTKMLAKNHVKVYIAGDVTPYNCGRVAERLKYLVDNCVETIPGDDKWRVGGSVWLDEHGKGPWVYIAT